MKTIIRRLDRLEERLAPRAETEFVRSLREKIERGNRRVAEARESGCYPRHRPMTVHTLSFGVSGSFKQQ